ncbi:MAG: ACT domain-containing protein, partial [Clostridia bacterium]|nr:ACT domain-containing protein [Clostridia bacterium]
NIDVSFITRIIELGLSSRGRNFKFRAKLLDIPGSLVHISKVVSDANANVIMVQYDRMSKELDPNEVIIHMGCEVGGIEHAKKVIEALEKNGYSITIE